MYGGCCTSIQVFDYLRSIGGEAQVIQDLQEVVVVDCVESFGEINE